MNQPRLLHFASLPAPVPPRPAGASVHSNQAPVAPRTPAALAALLVGLTLTVAFPLPVAAETRIITRLDASATLAGTWTDTGAGSALPPGLTAGPTIGGITFSEPVLIGIGQGRIDLLSKGAENTSGQLRLDLAWSGSQPLLGISRAWVKYSLDSLRLTMGKTVLAWGEGLVFNAGDLLAPDPWRPAPASPAPAGPGSPTASATAWISAEILRDYSLWVLDTTFALGDLSYLEVVASPPAMDLATAAPTSPPPWHDSAAGLRLYTDLGGIGLQTGYAFRGTGKEHSAYLSLNGALDTLNLNAAVSTVAPTDPALFGESVRTRVAVSVGASISLAAPWEEDLGLTLEALAFPGVPTDQQDQALLVFCQAGTTLDQTLGLSIRTLWKPLAPAFSIALPLSAALDQGLSLLATPALSWDHGTGGTWTLTAGTRFVF